MGGTLPGHSSAKKQWQEFGIYCFAQHRKCETNAGSWNCHALLYSMNRVQLLHPMATSTYKALIVPFEILTRANVNIAVKALAEKELVSKGDANKDGCLDAVLSGDNHDFVNSEELRDRVLDRRNDALINAEDSDMENGGSHDDLDEEMDDGAGSEGEHHVPAQPDRVGDRACHRRCRRE